MRAEQELKDIFNVCRIHFRGMDINTNKKEEVFKRWVYFRIAREITKSCLADIGKVVKRDHASVLHGLGNFEYDILGNAAWQDDYRICKLKSIEQIKWSEIPTRTKVDELIMQAKLRKKLAAINRTVKSLKGFRYNRTRIKY